MNNKKLVIHLIREELRNQRLMHYLENIGFDCFPYTLDISRVILELAGFREDTDELYHKYFGLIDIALKETTFENLDEMLDKWSMKIYIELLETRSKEKVLFCCVVSGLMNKLGAKQVNPMYLEALPV